jgi:hypothetical protein
MNALPINLKQQIGRGRIGGFCSLNNFLDLSHKNGGKSWKEWKES